VSGPLVAGTRTGDAGAEVAIEPMRRRHLRQVLRIDARQPGDRWSSSLFSAELARGDRDRSYLVATVGGRVVGFAGMLFVAPEAHLLTIVVDGSHRRRGVATLLLGALAVEARRRGADAMTLEVRASNDAALGLYRRFGFAPAGVRRAYYSDNGEDAFVLWCEGVDSPGYRDRLVALGVELAVEDAAADTGDPGVADSDIRDGRADGRSDGRSDGRDDDREVAP